MHRRILRIGVELKKRQFNFTEADINFAHKRCDFFPLIHSIYMEYISNRNKSAVNIFTSNRIEIISHKMKTRAIELWDIINSIELCNWISSWNQSVCSVHGMERYPCERYCGESIWSIASLFTWRSSSFVCNRKKTIGQSRKILLSGKKAVLIGN